MIILMSKRDLRMSALMTVEVEKGSMKVARELGNEILEN